MITPYPRGPLGPNPDNDKVVPADPDAPTAAQREQAHVDAVRAVVKQRQVAGLRSAAHTARAVGDVARARELDAEAAALEQS